MSSEATSTAATGVFHGARTVQQWQDRAVETEVLQRLFEVLRAGPTSANGFPLRLIFATSPEEKAKVVATAMASNRPCLEAAPVVAIVAYDSRFFEDLPIREIAARWRENPDRVHREYTKARDEFRSSLRASIRRHDPRNEAEVERELERLLGELVG